jgi:hypothetical protein
MRSEPMVPKIPRCESVRLCNSANAIQWGSPNANWVGGWDIKMNLALPPVRAPIPKLKERETGRVPASRPATHPSRGLMLLPIYLRICSRLSIEPRAAARVGAETSDTQAPHAQLRRTLETDAAMSALLPAAPGHLALGCTEDAPFFLARSGLLRVAPALLSDAAALSIAVRWGVEAAHFQSINLLNSETTLGVLSHGRSLLRAASIGTRDLLMNGVPSRIAGELLAEGVERSSETLLAWQRSRIEGLSGGVLMPPATPIALPELWHTVEDLLVAGGDTRLVVDVRSGFNRYGTAPRPRPQAVHFSSSTASSVSDYGFMYCDLLRRDLLAAMLCEKLPIREVRARAVDAIAGELLGLLGLASGEADVALAPSGTDTETLAVLVASASDQPVTNILIAPEETGRGVRLAAAGRYFDTMAASGERVVKGQQVWPTADITVVDVSIRDAAGAPRFQAAIEDDVRSEVVCALAKGRRVLLHMLASSKTGLAAPREATIDEIQRLAPQSIDVVVDSCQLRTPFHQIGEWARKGWMLQVSGSKFLTGPPFSGALIVPTSFRHRAIRVGSLLDQSPAVGFAGNWTSWWRETLPAEARNKDASFGLIFRWLPAVLEAELFNAIPDELRRLSFNRFRHALGNRLDRSPWLVRTDHPLGDRLSAGRELDLATNSIICFSVMASHWDGSRQALDEDECRQIFNLLNFDLSHDLGSLNPAEAAVARLQAHIGQPVELSKFGSARGAVLRMVLGARFFSIVAHAGPGSFEAALESEIADAIRALEKLELLARLWQKARKLQV